MYNILINEGFEKIGAYWKWEDEWFSSTDEALEFLRDLIKDDDLQYEGLEDE